MARANTTQYALLGLLNYRPMTGYEIKKMVDESIAFFWQENYGHIYPMLKRMEADGLVTSVSEYTDGKPPRKRYSITDMGRKAFMRWMEEDTGPLKIRYELLLKIFFSSLPGSPDTYRFIEAEENRMLDLIKEYDGIKAHLAKDILSKCTEKDILRWTITLNFGYHFARATLEWCRETRELLSEDNHISGNDSSDEK